MFSRVISKLSVLMSRYMNTKLVFIMDILLSTIASVTVLFVLQLFTEVVSWPFTITWVASSVFMTALGSSIFKGYKIIIRHSGLKDVFVFITQTLFKVVAMAAIVLTVSRFFGVYAPEHIFVVLAVDFVITLCLVVGVRVAMISLYNIIRAGVRGDEKRKKVLVYGMSDKAVSLVSRLQTSPHYNIVAFVSPVIGRNAHVNISGLPVESVKSVSDFKAVASHYGIDSLLFANDDELSKEVKGYVEYAAESGVKTLVAPTIDEYHEGVKLHHGIREVKIEDLLGREEIKISLELIKSYFKDKVVMVTGAAGSIGSEICRQLAGFGIRQLIMFDNAETPLHYLRLEFDDRFKGLDFVPVIGDVRNLDRIDYVMRNWKPQVVFHAAAYKHVPLMEENPCEAVAVNVHGSRNVADKCLEYGVDKMVMISTDKAVNPTNIMGCSKRLAEIYVQSLGLAIASGKVKGVTKFVTTRFGNVLGSNGSVIPRFRDQIAAGGPVTVTHPDINRFFMTIPEACRLVMEAATTSTGNQIVVFDMGEPVKIDTLARRMIQLSGLKPDVDIPVVYTGLRPGEKLYEEVLSNVENTDPTSHDRIRVARVREYDYKEATEAVNKLKDLAYAVDIPAMVKYMKKIVPEYKSNNSRFEKYDK